MNLDRSIPPVIRQEFPFTLIQPEKQMIRGVPYYLISGDDTDLVRLELVFQAGSVYEPSALIASTANNLLGEGTSSHSAAEINARLDYYGAYIEKEITHEHASVTLYCLGRFLKDVLPFFAELVLDSVFPDRELRINLNNRKASFESNLKKVEFVCRQHFPSLLFPGHPYGKVTRLEDYDQVTQTDVFHFYQTYYHAAPVAVFLSGKANQQTFQLVSDAFDWHKRTIPLNHIALPDYTPVHKHIAMEDTIQSAIRIGRPAVTQEHPDFAIWSLTNTILGGYFGSRLMKNIREEKGYTYGIGSALQMHSQCGVWLIATEVGAEYTQATLDEINKEILRMHHEPVGEEEMQIVKNYIQGNFLKSVDGPFAQTERIKIIVLKGLPEDYYQRLIEAIRKASADDVLQCMHTYLHPDQLSRLVVGKAWKN
ncbi:MAG: insulinase family protein [Flavobacteriales bacterium]|nr:insulinase family protein [Flavobacteriales bacterium]